ncbi:MAG: photosystem I reaction center subunit XII [Leptolyngbyaceae cyanobacterium SL_7_1]|nr:photosystem I reaction center subunit XII [Leptolyngbyaceae cyanobacterium SL_7_1]
MDSKSFELTLEQQFEIRRMQMEVQGMSREQALDLLLQASRLLMLKDNIVRHLLKQTSIQSIA